MQSKESESLKSILLVLVGVALLILLLNEAISVPQYADLSEEQQELLEKMTRKLRFEDQSDMRKLEAVLNYFNHNVKFEAPVGYDGDPSDLHDPLSILNRGWGLCYDHSYLFEMLAQAMGYRTRHIAILKVDEGGIFRSHAISEVLTDKGWVSFDPSFVRYYVDEKGVPIDTKTILEQGGVGVQEKIFGQRPKGPAIEEYEYLVYGVYNFHGHQFKPTVPYPDLALEQLHYNWGNMRLPLTYKNLHVFFLLGGFAFIGGMAALYLLRRKR